MLWVAGATAIESDGLLQHFEQLSGVARLADKIDGAQGAGVARVIFIVLTRQNDNFHLWGNGQKVADQGKSLVGAMR